ncbi:MAG TPA: SLC13 family permease [Thermohalobaculum sp.]|nr:SLC13 family permease [Thermohalobaculum sp.]
MTTDQVFLFALFGAVFALLLWGRWRYDLIAFSALLVGVIFGVVSSDQAFAGFGHPATIIVALVLVLSRGLTNSGAIFLITRNLVDVSRSLAMHITIMGGIGAALSAFMNNVAALALLMPVDVQTAWKAKRNPGLSLMPLSFATILGGMVTLIGTPPNIIIASYRQESLGAPFLMFDFAPVGLVCAIAGLAFVATIGWRLIPKQHSDAGSAAKLLELTDYIAELQVPETSPAIGKRINELEDEAEKADVAIIGLIRGGKRLYGAARNTTLQTGDALVVEARPEAIDELRAGLKLEYDGDKRRELSAAGEGQSLIEVVATDRARIVGRSALQLQLLRRHGVTLLGISRRGKRITERVRRTTIETGDILLLLGPTERLADVATWLGCLPLAERGLTVTQSEKAYLAAGLFAAAIAAASFGLVYLPVALGCVVALYVFTGIVPVRDIYDHVEWPVVVLLGSMIPLGTALEQAGGTGLIANGIVAATAGLPAWVILAVLMAVTMTLSDVLNNTATTIIAAPIAIDLAAQLGVNADPFLMAVAVAASCAFLTPIGHKNNTLILGPGGYAFGDYWRMGLPLELIVLATGVPAIMLFWPF